MKSREYYFNRLSSIEEKESWCKSEYDSLSIELEDCLSFNGKTSIWTAHERDIESQRHESDRLFYDPLAKHFCSIRGYYGERMSELMAYKLKDMFDPYGDIGFIYEGHVNYIAASTKLVNDRLSSWIDCNSMNKQIVNLGAGVDSRPFWLECLKKINVYIEIDTLPVNEIKRYVLSELKSEGEIYDSLCERKVISIDFNEGSIMNICDKGFNQVIPTCWILEHVIIYLSYINIKKLLQEISNLSITESYIIVSFCKEYTPCKPKDLDDILIKNGWKKEESLFFGEEKFNYNRYPSDKPPNQIFGFNFYKK